MKHSQYPIPVMPKNFPKAVRKLLGPSTEIPLEILSLYIYQQAFRRYRNSHQAIQSLLDTYIQAINSHHPQMAILLKALREGESSASLQRKWEKEMAARTYYDHQGKAISALANEIWQAEHSALTTLYRERLPTEESPLIVGIEETLHTLEQLLTPTSAIHLMALVGIGGIGKTTTAAEAVRRAFVSGCFSDIIWVSAQPHTFLANGLINETLQPSLTAELLVSCMRRHIQGAEYVEGLPFSEAKVQLREALQNYRYMVIIDNLETIADLSTLLPLLRTLANPSVFLMTSRESFYEEAQLYHVPIRELSPAVALQLIRAEAESRNSDVVRHMEDAELREVIGIVGGNPLALRLIVGQLHLYGVKTVINDLRTVQGIPISNLYDYIYKRAWERLDDAARHALLATVVLPPEGGELTLIQRFTKMDEPVLRRTVAQLTAQNLLETIGHIPHQRYRIHALTRTYLQRYQL